MPEARSGRRVGVVAGDGEALGARRRVGPLEMRRLVATGAAEAEIGRQNEILRQIVAVPETVAGDGEPHAWSPFVVCTRVLTCAHDLRLTNPTCLDYSRN